MQDHKRRLLDLQESERVCGYRQGERFAEIRSQPFERYPEDTAEPFDYCIYCNGRYTASTFFPYCSNEHAIAAESD